MSNQGIKNDSVNRTGTTSCEGAALGMQGVTDSPSVGCHEATDQKRENEMRKGSKQDCN